MSAERNKALVSRFHEDVFGRGELARINEVIAPDLVQHWGPFLIEARQSASHRPKML